MAWWNGYPWRMIQTNLREIDFQDLDPARYVEDLKSFDATVVLLNAGGISASYPTRLPWHEQNPWAADDKLRRVVELCHEAGIRVLARTDFSKVKERLYEAHPEWAFRTADGGVMHYNGYVQTCPNSVYQQEYAFRTLEEMFREIPFDGLYCNMGGFQTRDYSFVDYGFCHCEACRTRFREMSGYEDLPAKEDWSDPVYVAYTDFQQQCIRAYREKMVAFLATFDREICFDDQEYARIEAATELHRRLPHWQYHASSNCRGILGDGSSGIICSNTSVDYMGFALREVAVSPALQKLRCWQTLANLGALDYYLIGRIDNKLDRSGFPAIRAVFAHHRRHEEAYRGLRNLGRVLLRRNDRWVVTEEEKGWIRVLTEAHIPFAEVLASQYAQADLSRYELVILPDSAYLTPAEAEATDAFVRRGGTVLAVGGTGLSDAAHGRRTRPVLTTQGIRAVREERSDMASSMLLLDEADRENFPSNPASRLVGVGDRYLFLDPEPETEKLLRLVPVHPYGPPECCYFTEVTGEAGLFRCRAHGGTVVTIPWYPGEFFARTGFENLSAFMTDVLTVLCGARSLAPDLTPMAELTWSGYGDGGQLVQLVNHSGVFGVSFVEPVPLGPVTVRVPVPSPPRQVESLLDTPLRWQMDGGDAVVTLERLGEYDAVRLRWGEEEAPW